MNNFFDRLGKKANEAYQATKEKTVNLTEEIKIKTKNIEKSMKKVAEKFGGKEKSRTFATRLRKNGKFIDKFEKR